MEALGAGDTLVVHGGTYRERIELLAPAAGAAGQPISVVAAPGERVVVKGLLRFKNLRHWVIDAINVTWDDRRNNKDEHMVKFVDGENWQYRNSEVWRAESYAAVLVAGTPTNFLLQCLHVHDTKPTNDVNQDHLVYLNSGTGGGVVERSLLTGSPNGRAIKVGGASPEDAEVANVIIRYNTMRDNSGPSNVQLAWRTSNVLIERNIMASPDEGRANITTFELSGSDNVVRNNVGWHSAGLLEAADGIQDGGGNVWLDPWLDAHDDGAVLEQEFRAEYGQSGCPTSAADS